MDRRVLTLLFASGVSALVSCKGGDHLEVPTPREESYTNLHAVALHAVSNEEVIVVGNLTRNDSLPEGLILATETRGRTWRRMAVEIHDLSQVTFQVVHFTDRLRGWVGGIRVLDQGETRAVVFRTDDGGNHWREAVLPQSPDLNITGVHSLKFVNDHDGTVGVTCTGPDGNYVENYFVSANGGRAWRISSFREAPRQPLYDHSISMVDSQTGFRLAASRVSGVTLIETTGSGGKDWLPISELTLRALATYY